MTRYFRLFAGVASLAALAFPLVQVAAQQQVPPAPAQPPAQAGQAPASPAPAAPPAFPKPDPANFTAASPTKETVNSFLQQSWGYDDNRVWQVQAILKTPVDGISKVIVYIGDKTGKQKPQALQFFALPDGKHIIAGDEILPFGEHPYADSALPLQERADGPYRGSASKDLELVEFADFQCPHCKEAQANMEKLAADFPKARIVFQNYPLKIHPEAKRAASYGVCVAKQGGSTAFFQFAGAVFDGAGWTGHRRRRHPDPEQRGDQGRPRSGQDRGLRRRPPPPTRTVESSVKLAEDLNVNQTPMLMVNGRQLPVSADSLRHAQADHSLPGQARRRDCTIVFRIRPLASALNSAAQSRDERGS